MVVQKSRSMGESGPGGAAAAANKVRRGDIRHAIIVRTHKKFQRKDGMVVRFDDNACALIGKNGEPIGTRINGKLASLRSKVYQGYSSDMQALSAPSFEISSSRRYYHWHQCMYKSIQCKVWMYKTMEWYHPVSKRLRMCLQVIAML